MAEPETYQLINGLRRFSELADQYTATTGVTCDVKLTSHGIRLAISHHRDPSFMSATSLPWESLERPEALVGIAEKMYSEQVTTVLDHFGLPFP